MLKISFSGLFLLFIVFILSLPMTESVQASEAPAPEKKISRVMDSALILDQIALVKSKGSDVWIEPFYTLNENMQPAQLLEKISKSINGPDFENWTPLSEPKPVILISESGETATVFAKSYEFIKGCGNYEKLKLDFSNLPGSASKKWILAVVSNGTWKYEMKKLASSKDKKSFHASITSGKYFDSFTAEYDLVATTVRVLREKTIYLEEDCN